MMRILNPIAALALAITLTACSEEPIPTPHPEPAPATPEAVINDEQLDRILAAVQETLDAADAESNAEELSGRVTGPAARLREAEYDYEEAIGDPVSQLSTEPQIAIVSATAEWPRTVIVATAVPDDANLPLLMVLVQNSPRADYALWSWVRLLPGVELPTTVSASVGSAPVAVDSEDLLIPPNEVISQYVDVMNEGEDSDYADVFAEDEYRTLVATEAEELNDAVSDAGKATRTVIVDDDSGVVALETYSGGAIVFGSLTSETVVEKTVPRGTLTVGDVLAYGGDETVTTLTPLTAHHLTTIAFYVPPAGSEETVTVLGVEYILSGVTRGDEEEE